MRIISAESQGQSGPAIYPVQEQSVTLHLNTVWDFKDDALYSGQVASLRDQNQTRIYPGGDSQTFVMESFLIDESSFLVCGEERRQLAATLPSGKGRLFLGGLAVQRDFLLYPVGGNTAQAVALETVAEKSEKYMDERISGILRSIDMRQVTSFGLKRLMNIAKRRSGGDYV